MIGGCFTWISEHKHLDLIILQLLRSQNVDHKTQNLLFHARQSTMTFIKVNFLFFLDPLRYLLLHMFPGSHLQNKKETMRCPKRTSSIVWGHCNGFSSSTLISAFFIVRFCLTASQFYPGLYVKVTCCSVLISASNSFDNEFTSSQLRLFVRISKYPWVQRSSYKI